MESWLWLAAFVGGWFFGGIPTGVLVSRKKYGIDVREIGSGNIGATNITRAFGWGAGILVFVIDFLKGFIPVFLAVKWRVGVDWFLVFTSVGLVMGHCFSPFLRFGGGKGVATSFGCITAVLPAAAVIAAAIYAIALFLTRISAVGSLAGMLSLLVYSWILPQPSETAVMVWTIVFVVVVRHRSNIVRLVETLRGKRAK